MKRYTYDAFGQPTITDWSGNVRTQSAIGNRFMFQGREYLSELNIYDYRNRHYHPQLGRFFEKDPTGFDAGDMNLFRYCGDDPVDGSDPMGLLDLNASLWNHQVWMQGGSFLSSDQFDAIRQGFATLSWSTATVTGQHSRPGPKEPVGRGSREPSESDGPLRMLPPEEATTEGYGRVAYYQFASHGGKPLSGGNLKFQEATTKDRNNTFDIETSDKKPPHELIRGGLFKDHIGFKFRPEGRPPGTAILYQKFKSYYPNGQPGPNISTQLKHVTTLHADRTVTNSIYVIDP